MITKEIIEKLDLIYTPNQKFFEIPNIYKTYISECNKNEFTISIEPVAGRVRLICEKPVSAIFIQSVDKAMFLNTINKGIDELIKSVNNNQN